MILCKYKPNFLYLHWEREKYKKDSDIFDTSKCRKLFCALDLICLKLRQY